MVRLERLLEQSIHVQIDQELDFDAWEIYLSIISSKARLARYLTMEED